MDQDTQDATIIYHGEPTERDDGISHEKAFYVWAEKHKSIELIKAAAGEHIDKNIDAIKTINPSFDSANGVMKAFLEIHSALILLTFQGTTIIIDRVTLVITFGGPETFEDLADPQDSAEFHT